MSRTDHASEPSMDEILASIRRIIADDPGAARERPVARDLASGRGAEPARPAGLGARARLDEPLRAPLGSPRLEQALRQEPAPAAAHPVPPAEDDDIFDLVEPAAPAAPAQRATGSAFGGLRGAAEPAPSKPAEALSPQDLPAWMRDATTPVRPTQPARREPLLHEPEADEARSGGPVRDEDALAAVAAGIKGHGGPELAEDFADEPTLEREPRQDQAKPRTSPAAALPFDFKRVIPEAGGREPPRWGASGERPADRLKAEPSFGADLPGPALAGLGTPAAEPAAEAFGAGEPREMPEDAGSALDPGSTPEIAPYRELAADLAGVSDAAAEERPSSAADEQALVEGLLDGDVTAAVSAVEATDARAAPSPEAAVPAASPVDLLDVTDELFAEPATARDDLAAGGTPVEVDAIEPADSAVEASGPSEDALSEPPLVDAAPAEPVPAGSAPVEPLASASLANLFGGAPLASPPEQVAPAQLEADLGPASAPADDHPADVVEEALAEAAGPSDPADAIEAEKDEVGAAGPDGAEEALSIGALPAAGLVTAAAAVVAAAAVTGAPASETAQTPAAAGVAHVVSDVPATSVAAPAAAPLEAAQPAEATVKTLEDTVAELLRPMLRSWLDQNMPRIVEKAMRAEAAAIVPPKTPGETPET
ncbi:MAG: DUF2497 domain-containing protein [Hyphomicrobiaceae bacterium]